MRKLTVYRLVTWRPATKVSEFGGRQREAAVPQLVGEAYVCQTCGVAYADVTVQQAVELITSITAAVTDAIANVAPQAVRRRPAAAGGWSPLEYLCHLRDVYASYTIRLHRARTEDRPALEPMLNDLRAHRFRYNELDPAAVLDELARTAAGFCDEVATMGPNDWQRVVTRLPGEERTALWLIRQAMHEGQHHLHDIHRVGST